MADPVAASVLQIIDRWIGVPVCAALSAVNRVASLVAPPKPAPADPKKILFVKFAEQGSTVLAQHAIRRAVSIVGAENVYFLVFQENRFILDLLALVPEENVITFRRDTLKELVSGALAALNRIHTLQIDTVIDMEFFSRSSAAFTWLTRAPRRIGFHTFFGEGPYRGDLMTHRLLYNPYQHTSQIFEQMVVATLQNAADLPTWAAPAPALCETEPIFTAKPGEVEQVQGILKQTCNGEVPRSIILINPNASDLLPIRKWGRERYIALAKQLLERFPEAYVLLTGAVNEAAAADAIAREVGSPRCISMAGRTTLRQLFVLYTQSELLITNDSGPAHFAALTPIHTVVLFGPETPALFRAPTPRSTPIWLGLACSPCVNAYNNRQSPCRNNQCMLGITVERVFDEAVRVLETRRDASASAEVA